MSFLSVLKSIGHVVATGAADMAPFEPAIAAIPVAGAPIATVIGAITAVEGLVPHAGAGPAKKAAVTSVVTAAIPTIDPVALSSAIDQIVTALNAMSKASVALSTKAP